MIRREIGHFFVGLMFLTRLPVPAGLGHQDGGLARSARYFPLIGVIIGLIAAAVYLASSLVLPMGISAGLALAASILVTGALHEDGLADCCDGLGGGTNREHALEIMRDSRIGTYGAVALAISVGLRWAALAALEAEMAAQALIIAHALSRAAMPPVLVSGDYARTLGLASSVAKGVTFTEAAVAMLFAILVALIAGVPAGLAAIAAALVGGGIMLAILIRKIGGYTGDGLGAIQQCAEIAVLITLAGIWA